MRAVAVAVFGLVAFAPKPRAEPSCGPPDLLAAGLYGVYSNELRIEAGTYPDAGNQFLVGYRHYFEDVGDGNEPYRLQSFLQKATYADCACRGGPDEAWLVSLAGRYMFPDTPFGAWADFGVGKALVDAEEEEHKDLVFGGLGFDLYPADELAVEARFELGTRGYSSVQAGARFLARVTGTGDTIEFYGGYRGLTMEGADDIYDCLAEVRYFFDEHLFAGIEVAAGSGSCSFGLSGGYGHEKGFLAELELGTVKDGPEGWGDFVRISIGVRF
jgi:hypothetical protein